MTIARVLVLALAMYALHGQAQQTGAKLTQDEIIDKYLKNGAWHHDLFLQEWQAEIDKGLAADSTIAYLWQQKAMPLFKQRKYSPGMKYLDKAVVYAPERWQDYRAFIKCIFMKDYHAAILDFQSCIKRIGNSYVMDHSYHFYIALCYLQLNEFAKAEKLLADDIVAVRKVKGDGWVHHLDQFYLGIAKFEQKKYDEAIVEFDKALKLYPKFSDVKFYKATAFFRMGNREEAIKLVREAKTDFDQGHTINEDNVIYERYPYQVNWELVRLNP
ncbi:MAG: tetratricopeptide repeat protein [Bacteroidota bacterium]